MNRTRTERGNRNRGLWTCLAAMWMPALLLAAAAAGEPSDAGAAEKENKAPAGLDPTVLRFLPDDCRVIAQVMETIPPSPRPLSSGCQTPQSRLPR